MNRFIKSIVVFSFFLYAQNSWAITDTTQIIESTKQFAEFIIKNEQSKQKNYYFQFNGSIGKESLNGGREMMPQDANYNDAVLALNSYNTKRKDKKAVYIFHGRYYFSQRFAFTSIYEGDTAVAVSDYKSNSKKFFKQVVKPLKSSERREKIEFVRTQELNKRVWKAIKQQNPNINTEEIVIGFIVEEYVADFGTISIDANISSLTPKITQEAKLFFSYFKITPPHQIFALNEEIPVSPFTPTNESSPVYSKALLEVTTFLTKPTWQDTSLEIFNDVFEWIKQKQAIERENKLVEASLKDEFNKITDKRERFITWSRAKEGLLAFARFSESLKGNYEGTGFAFTSENPEDWASNPNIPKGNAIFVPAEALAALQAAMVSLGYSNAMSYDGKILKIDPTKIPLSTRTLREEVVRKAYEEVIDPLAEKYSKEDKLLAIEKKIRQIGSTWELVRVCGVQRLENNVSTPIDGILKGNINLLKDYTQVDAEANNLKIVFYFAQKTNAQGEPYNPNKTYLLLGSTDYNLVVNILDKIADKKQQNPNNCKITEEEAKEDALQELWSRITIIKKDKIITFKGDGLGTGTHIKLNNDGFLTATIKIIEESWKNKGLAGKMFDEAIEHFGTNKVKGIKAVWLSSDELKDNFEIFKKVYLETKDLQKAAFATPTGKIAKSKGFEKVSEKLEQDVINSINNGNVIIEFGKKENELRIEKSIENNEIIWTIFLGANKTIHSAKINSRGNLDMNIRLPEELQGKGLGSKFLDEALQHFEGKYNGFEANWTMHPDYPDNMALGLKQYWDTYEFYEGSTLGETQLREKAAFGTRLGKILKDKGFTIVEVPISDRDEVRAIFKNR